MKTQNAIKLLCRRAEYAMQKADTPDKQRKASDLVDAVNAVVDWYNQTENTTAQLDNLQRMTDLLLECLGVRYQDREIIKHADADFVRYNLLKESKREHELHPYRFVTPEWVFHETACKWDMLQYHKKQLQFASKVLFPELKNKLRQETGYGLLETFYNNLRNEISEDTDYSDIKQLENYFLLL